MLFNNEWPDADDLYGKIYIYIKPTEFTAAIFSEHILQEIPISPLLRLCNK